MPATSQPAVVPLATNTLTWLTEPERRATLRNASGRVELSVSVSGARPARPRIGSWIVTSASETSKNTFPTASTLIRAAVVSTCGRVTVAEPSFAVLSASTVGYVAPPSVDRLILTFAALIGAASVPATSHVTGWSEPASSVAGAPCEVTRNGPVPLASTSFVSARPMPPPPGRASRAVRRKCSVRSPGTPTQSDVGRNSEKQSLIVAGTSAGAAGAAGQTPVLALVLPARIWPMSGNTRVGSVVTAFSPGDGLSSVSVALTLAAVPNCRNSGPLALTLFTSPVPPLMAAGPASLRSHTYVSGSPSESVAPPVRANGVRSGIV